MSTKSNLRLNAITQFKEALITNSESLDFSESTIDKIANEIEDYIYDNSNQEESSKNYRDKIREIKAKIKKRENLNKKNELLSGKITIDKFINERTKEINPTIKNFNSKGVGGFPKKIVVPPKIKMKPLKNNLILKEDNNNFQEIEKINEFENKSKNEEENKEKKEDLSNNTIEKRENINTPETTIFCPQNDKIKNSNDEINFIHLRESMKKNDTITSENTLSNNLVKNDFFEEQIIQPNQEKEVIKENETDPFFVKKKLKKNNSFSDITSEKKKNERIELNHKYLELELKYKQSETKCSLYKKELDSLRNELNSLKEKLIEVNTKNKQLEIDLTLSKTTIKNQKIEIERLNNINNKYDKNYKTLKEKVDKKNVSLESKIEKFMTDLDKLSDKFSKSSLNSISVEKLNIDNENKESKIEKKTNNLFDSIGTGVSFSSFINK